MLKMVQYLKVFYFPFLLTQSSLFLGDGNCYFTLMLRLTTASTKQHGLAFESFNYFFKLIYNITFYPQYSHLSVILKPIKKNNQNSMYLVVQKIIGCP